MVKFDKILSDYVIPIMLIEMIILTQYLAYIILFKLR